MPVDKTTVAKIARLARLNVLEDRLEPVASELNGILDWIAELNEVQTDNVEPLARLHESRHFGGHHDRGDIFCVEVCRIRDKTELRNHRLQGLERQPRRAVTGSRKTHDDAVADKLV